MEGEPGLGYFTSHAADIAANGYNFFAKEKAEDAFYRSEIIEIKPINSLSAGPIWFQIGAADSYYFIPLDRIRCEMEISITKANGDDLDDTENDKVYFVNYLGNNLFENINVKLNGAAISDHSRLHHLRSSLQLYYSYNRQTAKYNHSINRYCYTTRTMDKFHINDFSFISKKGMANNSKHLFLNFIPLLDIASSNNFLCKTHDLFLEFERGRDGWCLIHDDGLDIKIKIHDFKLQVQRLFPTPLFEAAMNKKIASNKIFYNFTRNVMRTHQLYIGSTNCSWNNIFIGQLPRSVYFVFLNNDQISSSPLHDPQLWLNYGVSGASVTVNGYRHPASGIKYNHTTGDLYNGYRWFMDKIGILSSNDDVGMDLTQYYKSGFMIPFDLTPRADNGFLTHAPNTGSINFTATYDAPTSKPLTVVCYAVFDNSISVDPKRDVILDYQI